WGGDNAPDRDYPRYCKLLMSGRLDLEPLLSRSYGLADVNAALDELERGKAARPLLDIAGAAGGAKAAGYVNGGWPAQAPPTMKGKHRPGEPGCSLPFVIGGAFD